MYSCTYIPEDGNMSGQNMLVSHNIIKLHHITKVNLLVFNKLYIPN